MTIYIAGPMTGYPDYNRPAFDAAAAELRENSHRVINPADIKELPYGDYWPINKAMLDGSDAIYLLNGWITSRGATREYCYACDKGMQIMSAGMDRKGK